MSAGQGGDDAVGVLLMRVVTAGRKSREYGICCESGVGCSHVVDGVNATSKVKFQRASE